MSALVLRTRRSVELLHKVMAFGLGSREALLTPKRAANCRQNVPEHVHTLMALKMKGVKHFLVCVC